MMWGERREVGGVLAFQERWHVGFLRGGDGTSGVPGSEHGVRRSRKRGKGYLRDLRVGRDP